MKIFNKYRQLSRKIQLVVITALIVSCVGVYAAGVCVVNISASDVSYKGTPVQVALDELYALSENYCPEGYICKRKSIYVSSTGNDTSGNGTIEKPFLTIEKAYLEAEDNSTIYIMDNLTKTTTLNLSDNKAITLTSCTKESDISCPSVTANSIIRDTSLTTNMINQTNGSLTFNKIIVDGNNIESNSPMIYNSATLNVSSDSIIKNANTTTDGGAIYNDDGTLNIRGGTITNNISSRGAGIYIANAGTFRLSGGTIKNNTASTSGGGIYKTTDGIYTKSGSPSCSGNGQSGLTTACAWSAN